MRPTFLLHLFLIFLSNAVVAQESRLPIIDMHFHAVSVDSQGPPPVAVCAPFRGIPVANSKSPYADQWNALQKNPPCDDAIWSPTTDQKLMSTSLATLEKYNIIGVTSGPAELVAAYYDAEPSRIIQGLLLGGPHVGEKSSIESLRALHSNSRLQVIGELTTQYVGIAPDRRSPGAVLGARS